MTTLRLKCPKCGIVNEYSDTAQNGKCRLCGTEMRVQHIPKGKKLRYPLYGDGAYTGPYREGLPHGFGRFDWYGSLKSYQGEFRDGNLEGHGQVTDDDSVFCGEFRANIQAGPGKLVSGRTHTVWEGEWEENNFRRGTQTSPDGTYTGEEVDGYMFLGRWEGTDGDVFEGEWRWCHMWQGRYTRANGEVWEGSFRDGKPDEGRYLRRIGEDGVLRDC